MSMDQWWNDTDRGKLKYWRKKTCPSATEYTTNLTRIDLGWNPSPCGES
jgi:hypothetical protein